MEEELSKLRGDHPMTSKEVLKRTLKYVKPEIGYFIIALIFIILNVLVDSVTPILMQLLTDNLKSSLNISMSVILAIAFGSLGLAIINQAFLYVESMILQKAGQRIVYKIRVEVFTHI